MSKFGRFSNRVLAGSLAALTFSGPNVQAQGSNYQPTATYATPVVSGDRKNGNHVVQAQAAQPREEKSALPARTSSSARVNTAQRSEFNQATTATPRADSRGKVKAHDRSRQQVNHEGKSFGASNGGSSMADMSTTERIASDNRPHAHAVPVRHTDLVAAARAQEEGVGFRIKRNEGRTTNPETQARKMTDKDNERYICRKRNSQRKVKWDNKGRDFEHFEDNRDLRTAQEASSSPQNTSFRRGSRRLDVPAEEMEKYFNITPNAESADGKLALLPENNLVPRVNGIAEAQPLEAAVQHASALPTTNLSANETFPSSAFPGESSAISGAHPATTAGLLRTEEAGLPAHEWVSSASIEPHVSNGAALAVHSTPEAHTGTAHIPSAEVKAGVKAEQSFIQSLGRYASEAGAMVSKHSGKTAIATGLLTAASFAIPNAEQQVIAADGTQTTEQRASFGKKTLITVGSLMTAALAADLLPGATKGWVGRVLENQGAQKAILG